MTPNLMKHASSVERPPPAPRSVHCARATGSGEGFGKMVNNFQSVYYALVDVELYLWNILNHQWYKNTHVHVGKVYWGESTFCYHDGSILAIASNATVLKYYSWTLLDMDCNISV